MRYARLFVPYRGYWDIQVDLNSIEGGYHGYQYNCIVVGSGAEIIGISSTQNSMDARASRLLTSTREDKSVI